MATVIDSLIVELGLDPRKFNDGQRAALDAFKKTSEQARKSGREIEESGDKAAQSITKLTSTVLSMFAAFAAGVGIASFTKDILSADAALGRLSGNLGESPQDLYAWQKAAERVGGSADSVASTFENVSKSLVELRTQGKLMPREFSDLRALTGINIELYKGPVRFLNDASVALKKLYDIDPSRAHSVAQALGIDDATATMMFKNGAGLKKILDDIEKGAPSDGTIAASQKLQETWARLSETATGLANKILTELAPTIERLLKQFTEWLDKNKDLISDDVVKWIGDFASGIKTLAQDANDIAQAFGGWKTAIEGIVIAFAAIKAMQLVSLLGGIKGALGPVALAAGGVYAFDKAGGLNGIPDAMKPMFLEMEKKRRGFNVSDIRQSNQPDYGALTRDPSMHGEALANGRMPDTTVNGVPVSQSNPLPVEIKNGSSGSSGGFWSSVGNAISSFFGSPAAAADMPSNGASSPATYPKYTGGGNPGAKGWWTEERQAHAVNRLMSEAGFSEAGARGFVSRWKNVEATGGPASVNPTSGAFGIAQWLGSRKTGIAGNTNFDDQLSHVIKEVQSTERRAGDLARRAKTADEGATAASMFERAEGYNPRTGRDFFTGTTAAGVPGIAIGAKGIAAMNSATTNNNTSNSSSVNATIGTVNVNAPNATDANGVAAGIGGGIKNSISALANFGLR